MPFLSNPFKTKSPRGGFQGYTIQPPTESDPQWLTISPDKTDNPAQDKEAEAALHADLVRRAVYGDVGQEPGQSYDEKLSQEMNNPIQPMTQGESNFRQDPFAVDKLRAQLKMRPTVQKGDPTGDLLQFVSTFDPKKQIPTGKTSIDPNDPFGARQIKETRAPTPDDVMNLAVKTPRFKGANFNDPRIKEALQARFSTPVPTPPPPIQPPSNQAGSVDDASVIDYLGKLKAKDTPANREWARKKIKG